MAEDKYKQLHLLIDQITQRLQTEETENIRLTAEVRTLKSHIKRLESIKQTAEALREWKEVTTSILKKLYTKIDKEIERMEQQASSPDLGKK